MRPIFHAIRERHAVIVITAILAVGGGLLGSLAYAAPNDTTDIVAPYVHFPLGEPVGGAAGPLTTLFIIRSTSTTPVPPLGLGLVVKVTCFNDQSAVISALSGASVRIGQSFVITPEPDSSLIPTTHPSFTGVGWCYFAQVEGGTFAVDVVWGIYGGPRGEPTFDGLPDFTELRMFRSNTARAIASASGQSHVADAIQGRGNVPLWFGGNWLDVLVLVNPGTSSTQAFVDVSQCSDGCDTPFETMVPLPARGMRLLLLSSFANPPLFEGSATIRIGQACCITGWQWRVNVTTLQATLNDVPLAAGATRTLSLGDRP